MVHNKVVIETPHLHRNFQHYLVLAAPDNLKNTIEVIVVNPACNIINDGAREFLS